MRRRDVISAQPSNAILNLRGSVELSGCRSRKRVSASAYGVTSKRSSADDAGVRAAGDVAHRVAARLARRQAGVGEQAHRRLDVVQLHEMELDVLPRRDVAEAARVLLADVGERVELRRW